MNIEWNSNSPPGFTSSFLANPTVSTTPANHHPLHQHQHNLNNIFNVSQSSSLSFDQTPPQTPLKMHALNQTRSLTVGAIGGPSQPSTNCGSSSSLTMVQTNSGVQSMAPSREASLHKKLDRSFSEPAERRATPAASVPACALSTRYKTELCRSFVESGVCKYGEKCQFAHGQDELRAITRHPKFKTENCKRFHSVGFCPYGPRCHFIHNDEEQRKFAMGLNGNNSRTFPSYGSTSGNATANSNSVSFLGEPSGNFRSVSSFNTSSSMIGALSGGSSSTVVRPKALSFGSSSLGSSGEISNASSSSQSPTSLGTFFSDVDNFKFDSSFSASTMTSAFSGSPNSYSNVSPWATVFGGSQPSLKPDESPDNSDFGDIFNICGMNSFGLNSRNDPFSVTEKTFFDQFQRVSVSPSVDSVNSELEALKLSATGSDSSGFSPISAFSPAAASSPPQSSAFNSFFGPGPSSSIPDNNRNRLPTFAKISSISHI